MDNKDLQNLIDCWERKGFTFRKKRYFVELFNFDLDLKIDIWLDDEDLYITDFKQDSFGKLPFDMLNLLYFTIDFLKKFYEFEKYL